MERVVLEGVNRKRHALALFNLSDVCFVHVGHDFHLAQVFCNHEQCRRAHGGGNGLTDIYCAFQYNAVNRALDGRVTQVQACLGDFVLALFQRELGCI